VPAELSTADVTTNETEGSPAQGDGGSARAKLPKIGKALAKAFASDADDDDETPKATEGEGKTGSGGARGEGGGKAGKSAKGEGKAATKAPAKASTKSDAADDEGDDEEAGKSGSGGGKAAAGDGGKAGKAAKSDEPSPDEPGYRAYLKRREKRVEESEERISTRVRELGEKERDLAAREQKTATHEKSEKLWREDPFAALESFGWDPQKVATAFLERERTGKVTTRPSGAAGEGGKGDESDVKKRLDEMEAKELERTRAAHARDFIKGVSEDTSTPHLDAYLSQLDSLKEQGDQIGSCYNRFVEENGRAPKSDAELRGYMERLAKRLLSSPEARAKYERLKKIYEPAEEAAEDVDADGDDDGEPATPARKGRTAEGQKPKGKVSLSNRESTRENAPASQYLGKGAISKLFARHRVDETK
jgi:hypothetical protein